VIGRPNTPISRAICWLMSRYWGRSVTPVSSKNRRIAWGWLNPVASVTTAKSSPPSVSCRFCSDGISSRQGAHHVAQKFRTTWRPS
jgi:hypothetical protein